MSYIKITTFDSFSIVLVVVEEGGERVDEAADWAVVVGARLKVRSGSLKVFQLCYFIVGLDTLVYRFVMDTIFFILDYQIMICVIVYSYLLKSVEKYGYQAMTSVKHVPEQTVLPGVLNLNQ